jgi:hypothetical protein
MSEVKPLPLISKKGKVSVLQKAGGVGLARIPTRIRIPVVKMESGEFMGKVIDADAKVACMPDHPVVPGTMPDDKFRHDGKIQALK